MASDFCEDVCRECGEHLGYGHPAFHLEICDDCKDRQEMTTPKKMTREELEAVVGGLQQTLFLTSEGKKFFWDPEKEWDSDTLELIGELADIYNLRPKARRLFKAD